jgi:hypothetical protein
MVQIAGRNSKKIPAKEASLVQEGPGKQWEFGKITAAPKWPKLQAQLEAARIRQEANIDLYRDKTAELLNEVTVRAQKYNERPDDIQMRSLHNVADAVAIFDDKSPRYPNLYEMIKGKFAGVTVIRGKPDPSAPGPPGYMVFARGMNSYKGGIQALFLMDGVPIRDRDGNALMSFNPGDIERVEVLKNAGTVGIYGMHASQGVIAFYSKRARSLQVSAKQSEGMTPVELIGYPSVQREFYVPRYDNQETTSTISEHIDNRDVLYWKPMIQTDNEGNSQLRFPLSDTIQAIRIEIQGITDEGRPVLHIQSVQIQ